MNTTLSETNQIYWWVWTLLIALAVSASQNFAVVLLLILLVLWAVRRVAVVKRYSFSMLIGMLATLLTMRILFQMFFGIPVGDQVMFQLPKIELMSIGLRIGGIFTFESLQTAVNEAVTLGGIIIALLASSMMIPVSSLLRRLPSGFSNIALVLTIALSFLPQLMKDVKRLLRANRWRGHSKRKLSVIALNLINIVENALEKSILVSASMWRRGLGSETNDSKNDSIRLFGTILFLSSLSLAILFQVQYSLVILMAIGSVLILFSFRDSFLNARDTVTLTKGSLTLLGVAVFVAGIWQTHTESIELLFVCALALCTGVLLRSQGVSIAHADHQRT